MSGNVELVVRGRVLLLNGYETSPRRHFDPVRSCEPGKIQRNVGLKSPMASWFLIWANDVKPRLIWYSRSQVVKALLKPPKNVSMLSQNGFAAWHLVLISFHSKHIINEKAIYSNLRPEWNSPFYINNKRTVWKLFSFCLERHS